MKRAIVSLARFQAVQGHGEELGLRLCELLLRGHWASPQALEAHLQLPRMQVLGQLVSDGLVRRLQMSLTPVISRSSGG